MNIEEFARFVSDNRKKRKMTLFDFGSFVGTSWVTIWRWENQYCMPKKDAFQFWKDRVKNGIHD